MLVASTISNSYNERDHQEFGQVHCSSKKKIYSSLTLISEKEAHLNPVQILKKEMKENISKFMLCLLQWSTIHYSGRPFSSILKFFINLQIFINNNGIIFFQRKNPNLFLYIILIKL